MKIARGIIRSLALLSVIGAWVLLFAGEANADTVIHQQTVYLQAIVIGLLGILTGYGIEKLIDVFLVKSND